MNPTLFLHALVRTSLEAGVLVLLVLAAQRLFRRQLTPSWTCALWLLVMLRLLPISFGSSFSVFNWLPRWFEPPASVRLPPTPVPTPTSSPSAPLFLSGKSTGAPSAGPSNASTPVAPSSGPADFPAEPAAGVGLFEGREGWSRSHGLLVVWLAGVLALGSYVGWESFRFRRRLADLRPVEEPDVLEILRADCTRLGVRLPRLSESAGVESPGLYGFFRPHLLLPVGFVGRFSREELRFVFLHELAHIKRLDLPLNWLATLLQVIHWFNPLVWLGFARWRIDREIACDARAIAAAGAAANHAYGQTILRLLEGLTLPLSRPGVVGIVENQRQLQRRMRMIAGYAEGRRPFIAIALAAALAVIGGTDARTQMASGAAPIQVAATEDRDPASPSVKGSVTIGINKDGTVSLNGHNVSDNELLRLLAEVKNIDRDIPVLIKADETTPLKRLTFVMDACRKAGLNRFSLQSRQALAAQLAPPAPPAAASAPTAAVPVAPQLVDGRDPVSGVSLRGERVLFLLNTSGSMLGETMEAALAASTGQSALPGRQEILHQAELARQQKAAGSNKGVENGRTFTVPSGLSTRTDAEKRSAPKWQRSLQILRWLLAALGPEQEFQIVRFDDRASLLLPITRANAWIKTQDTAAAAEVLAQLNELVPQGGANLEAAFSLATRLPALQLPDNIVLITDGLPTRSDSLPFQLEVDEATRIRYFEVARKHLPPRVLPVQTVLLPLDGDPGAPGRYWELANATRGSLVAPARNWPALERDSTGPATPGRFTPIGLVPNATHLAIIVDTSGSMRDPNRGGLWWDVTRAVGVILDAHPQLAGVQLLDGDGRFILGEPRVGTDPWLAVTTALRDEIAEKLSRYGQDSISNPVPGIRSALSSLYSNRADRRIACYLFGDEFIDVAAPALRQLDELNPADANGNRKVTINAVGFPTTIRFAFSMGQTGVKFANLMRTVAHQHGGAFIALDDLRPPPVGTILPVMPQALPKKTKTAAAPPGTPEEFTRAYQQAIARKRAEEAKAWAQVQEDARALEPVARFNALLAATEALLTRAEFRAAARALKTTLEAKPPELPLPPAFTALEAAIQAQSTPVPVSVVSDQATWVAIFDFRTLGQFTSLTVDVPPGDYEVIGRRKGYRDVVMKLQIRNDAPPPSVTVICNVPDTP